MMPWNTAEPGPVRPTRVPAGGHWRPASRIEAGLAWAACAASLILTTLGLWVSVKNGDPGRQFLDPVTPAVAIVFPPVGASLVSRGGSARAVGWLLLVGALFGVSFFAEQYSIYLALQGASLRTGEWLGRIANWTAVPPVLVPRTVLLLFLPDGRISSRRKAALASGLAGAIALSTVLAALEQKWQLYFIDNRLELLQLPQLSGPANRLTALLLVVFGLICLGVLLVRYRRSEAEERPKLKLLVSGAALAVLAPIIALPLTQNLVWVYEAVGLLALIGLPIAILTAVFRYHLFGLGGFQVDAVTSDLIVYSGIVVLTVGICGAILRFLQLPPGLFVAAGASVVAWPLLRWLLEAAVNRLRHGARAYEVLRNLGQRLESARPPSDVLPDIADTIASALSLPYVRVEVGHGNQVTAAAESGKASGTGSVDGRARQQIPMLYRNEVVGRLIAEPRSPESTLDPADLRLLQVIAEQAGVAAYAVRLTEDLRQSNLDLQRSRERLVTARESEKARLSSRLHRDVKQDLAATLYQLEAASKSLARANIDVVRDQLEEAKTTVKNARDVLHSLSHQLRPPALDELGFVGALRQQAAAFALSPERPTVVVTVKGPIEGLTHAVEVAAYRIAQAALENAAEHAGSRHCELILSIVDGWLALEVCDDGVGIADDAVQGVGIADMKNCAEELGGECRVESAPYQGCRVVARLPVSRQ